MLRVLTYNLLEGGRDKLMGDRTETILSVLTDIAPDVAILVEANGFQDEDRRAVFEDALKATAYMAYAPTGFHIALLIGKKYEVTFHGQEPGRFFHAATSATIHLTGKSKGGTSIVSKKLTVIGAHLDPFSPESRLAEARILTRYANPTGRVILAGDFNELSPADALDASVKLLPRRVLARHMKVPIQGDGEIDSRSHELLQWAGFVDVYRKLNPKKPGWTLLTTRFAAELRSRMRMDFVYATDKMAAKAVKAEVIETDATRRASDHYPILAEFDV